MLSLPLYLYFAFRISGSACGLIDKFGGLSVSYIYLYTYILLAKPETVVTSSVRGSKFIMHLVHTRARVAHRVTAYTNVRAQSTFHILTMSEHADE